MCVHIVPRDELEAWLEASAQALLDTVSELADEEQEILLRGIKRQVRRRLRALRALRRQKRTKAD